jgi:hypothetical protein
MVWLIESSGEAASAQPRVMHQRNGMQHKKFAHLERGPKDVSLASSL